MAELLVVASKVKDFIRSQSEMNTSAAFLDRISEVVKQVCQEAIFSAKEDGRKTVMDRDIVLHRPAQE